MEKEIMVGIKVYFSDFFNVDGSIIDEYGAINISLINDMPLFVDPFLLFNSEKEEYKCIHNEIIEYLVFLQNVAKSGEKLSTGMRNAWFNFSEVKQNWLGFSLSGNAGNGMGKEFAENLYKGLSTIYKDFSEEKISRSRHLEKLCLISPRVGKDKISDFTTCFIKRYLLEYTENFAKKYLDESVCAEFNVNRAYFNWDTKTWATKKYYLPTYNHDYVLLTPKDLLTCDETFINRSDMLDSLDELADTIDDDALRFQLNQYFKEAIEKKLKKREIEAYAESLIKTYPVLIDYYIKYKEDHEEQATYISEEKVKETSDLFVRNASELISMLSHGDFYSKRPDVYIEALERVKYMKHVIEDQDGYKLFYIDGKPVQREADVQVIYRLTWYGSIIDLNRETNNGRGPVDYKASYGKNNSSLIEFKLAKNSKLKQNLKNQVEIYKKASDTDRAIKVIMFFSEQEERKVIEILKELGLDRSDDIILIDARADNKASASNVK